MIQRHPLSHLDSATDRPRCAGEFSFQLERAMLLLEKCCNFFGFWRLASKVFVRMCIAYRAPNANSYKF